MTITLYRLPYLGANKDKTISFSSDTQRIQYFNSIAQKLVVSSSDSTIGRIKNIANLNQEITIFNNGRDPYFSYNYVCINTNGKNYYYFVTDFKEIGNSQVVYSLKKDTLLTYVTTPNQGVILNEFKALVTREHKPRFNFSTGRALYHRIPEPGDTTKPVLYSVGNLSGLRRVRYVYKNRTDSKPVAYPYVESPLSVTVQGSDWIGTITSCIAGSNETMYVWDGSFHYTFGQGDPSTLMYIPSTQYVKYIRTWTPLGEYRFLSTFLKTTGEEVTENLLSVPSGVDLRIKVSTTNIQTLRTKRGYINVDTPWSTIVTAYPAINFAPTSVKALPLWSDINTYDAMTDRIIELPYFDPTGMTFYEDGYGIFLPLETDMMYTLSATIYNPFGYNTTKSDIGHIVGNDPKLYTSQFAPIILTLHGNPTGIKREMLHDPSGIPTNIDVGLWLHNEVLFPSTFNTSVYFNDHGYDVEDADELERTFDVNNEIASIKDEAYTYNQYYKDLDDKTRKIQESAAIRNSSLNAVNQALGVTGGMIAGGNPNPVQLATRAGQATINVAQSFMDLQDQLKLNTIQAKQKYIGLLLSSTKIVGAPLGYLRSLSKDRWGIQTYHIKDLDLAYWDQVFHKFGYTTLEYKNPNLVTRKYWDYKKMIIDELSSAFINDECIDDIKMRFAEGVTIYHADTFTIENPSVIDWNQFKENWEL